MEVPTGHAAEHPNPSQDQNGLSQANGTRASPRKPLKDEAHIDVEHLGDLKKGGVAPSKLTVQGGNAKAKKRTPLQGYALLVTALLALSSVGVALDLQGGSVGPDMKAYWRMVATTIALVPLAGRSVYRDGWPKLSPSEIRQLLLCILGYTAMTTSFATTLSMTSMAECYILSNVHSLVLIGWKVITRQRVLLAEGAGAVIGLLGVIICADDTNTEDPSSIISTDRHQPVLGGLVAIVGCVAMAAYLTLAKRIRESMDLFVFMFCLMGLGSFYLLAFMLIKGDTATLSNDTAHGLWGWTNLSPDRLPLELYLAVVVNLIGTTGYVGAMKYFEPIVVSTTMLMEPLLATLMGAGAGVDTFPGLQTRIGGALVTMGCFLVIWSDSRKICVKAHHAHKE